MTPINLLPWRERRRTRRQRAFVASLGIAVLAGVCAVAVAATVLDGRIAEQMQRNRTLADRIAALDARLAEIDRQRSRHAAVRARAAALNALAAPRFDLAILLDGIAAAAVSDVTLTALSRQGAEIVAAGITASSDDVAELLRELAANEDFAAPRLDNIADAATGEHSVFQLTLRFAEVEETVEVGAP